MSPVLTQTDHPMSSTHGPSMTSGSPVGGRSGRRRSLRRTMVVLGAVVLTFALGACTGAVREPTNYGKVNDKGEGFYGNLMYGCTGVTPDEDGNYVDEKLSSADYCKCLFTGLSDRVPFSDVRDFEKAQADAAADEEPPIPDEIARVQRDCAKKFPTSS